MDHGIVSASLSCSWTYLKMHVVCNMVSAAVMMVLDVQVLIPPENGPVSAANDGRDSYKGFT